MTETNETIQRIINLRKENNITQAQLAFKIGVGNTVMSKIENGTRGISADELSKIANVFNTTTDSLLGRKINDEEAKKRIDLADALDNHEYMTYQGKEIDPEDLELIKRILKNK